MASRDAILDRLSTLYPGLSPQLRLAAKYVLDAPAEVAINSMRRIAAAAGVGPSTMLRLAKRLGFPNYESFRRPFQEATRTGQGSFADRAEWLQSLAGGAREGDMLGNMAMAAISNIEKSFETLDPQVLADVADQIRQARKVYIFSGGGLLPIAAYFHAVVRMILPNSVMLEGAPGSEMDVLLHAGPADVMVVISCEPYARSTLRGARIAKARGAKLIALTDSRASPLAPIADALLLVQTQSPHFFPSQVAVVGLLETLIALIVLNSDASTVEKIDEIERLRHAEGLYWQPASTGS